MQPSGFNEANAILGPPPSMNEDQCGSLYVAKGLVQGSVPVVISCWKPTKSELDALQRGEPLWLIIYGVNMPPVALTTERPFDESATSRTSS